MVGEKLRSWYLFDFHADCAQAARGLIDGVAAQARAAGIDYCYIIHSPGQKKIVSELRSSFPAVIAPIVPFSVMARTLSGEPLRIDAPYIDIRDM